MPRRAHRTHPLGVLYFVGTAGLLVGSSVRLDRRGEIATATVKQKREEITIQQEPRAGWERFYRVGVEFPTGTTLGMATLDLPRERYDALRVTYLERNRYHFRTLVIGLALLGILAAWGARTRRSRRRVTRVRA
jgi:hypothetical protein